MNKQYVPYDIALLLKEKGFDIECYNYYTLKYDKKKPHRTKGIEYMSDSYTKFDWNCNTEASKSIKAPYPNEYHESQCSAPEIWQVIQWIFDKYIISIEGIMNIPEEGEHDGCYVFNGFVKGSEDFKLKIYYKSENLPTKEKAELSAIEQFLKNN